MRANESAQSGKSRRGPSWRPLLIGGLLVSMLACRCWGPFQHARQLITPTNTIGFQELWRLEVGGHERQTLLVADVDGDGAEELLLSTAEVNQLLVIEEGQITGEVQLQVPERAMWEHSEVLADTHLAKILSTGFTLSLVDLSTGSVVETLGQLDRKVVGDGAVSYGDILGDAQDEFMVTWYVGDPQGHQQEWETAIFNAAGAELWRRNILVRRILYTGDLDADGEKESVTADWKILDSQGHAEEIGPGDHDSMLLWVGDLGGDGAVELVAGLHSGAMGDSVGVYTVNGKREWSYELEEPRFGAVGDIDGDGKQEIAAFDRHYSGWGISARAVASPAQSWIFLFDASGELLWNWMAELSVDVYPGGFADVNGDGWDELVFFQYGPSPKTLYVYGVHHVTGR
ncbi:MAG: hypothetical protein K8R89_01005 [Anaerolineae bacterium]|nr:hypothetical protein [Anaerolineae bacterium]